MSSTFSSRTYNFNTILGRSSFPDYTPKCVKVPSFQRSYSWDTNHVATFWDDIWDFYDKSSKNDTYFLGPVVVLPAEEEIVVLDGQQRLATATILLSALRDYARSNCGQPGNDLARDVQRDHIWVDENDELYALELNELDNQFFKNHIQSDPPDAAGKTTLRSHRLILQASKYFQTTLTEKCSGLNATKKYELLRKLKSTIVDRLKLVVIEVGSEEEAYQIFETLNDRGLRLSVPDLLLNFLMKSATTKPQREKIRKNWDAIITNTGTRRVSTFLRHMWVSKYGDVKSQSLYREIRGHIQAGESSSLDFSKMCLIECKAYSAIINVDSSALGSSAEHIDALVRYLGADKTYPALLAGINCLSESDCEKLCRYLLALYVRHTVFADLNPSILEDVLYKTARAIREKHSASSSSSSTLAAAKKVLKSIDPTKQQIQGGMENCFLKRKHAQYLLHKIASQIQSPTKAISVNDNSIEHIFPENPKAASWSNIDDLAPYVWHIGNLSILEKSINRDIGNSSFKVKSKKYSESSIKLTSVISKEYKTVWNSVSVVGRAKSLVKHIEQIWKI